MMLQYEAALAKDKARDPQVLACLGRAWLMKGKQEGNLQALKTSLDYSNRVCLSSRQHLCSY
jgi:RNA polymerase-associated protein CTR9